METQVKETGLKAVDTFDRRKWKDGVKRTALRWIRSPPWTEKPAFKTLEEGYRITTVYA